MRGKNALLACSVFLLLLSGTTACQKVEKEPGASNAGQHGPLVAQKSASEDGIPLEYGHLIGVTSDPVNQWQAVLWFEGPDQNVTAVWVNTGQRRVVGTLEIPRR